MSAPHFFVDSLEGEEVRLTEADTRHALRSLRLRPGDHITVADGRGAIGRGRLGRQDGGRAVIGLEERSRVFRRPPLLSVAFAPPKGARLTWAIQKLSELGIDEAVLIQTDRSVRAWSRDRADRSERAVNRLRSVAHEAAMQARQPFVTEVRMGGALQEVLADGPHVPVMLWEEATAPLQKALPDGPEGIRLLVGPEGGFTEAEAAEGRATGAALASLGTSVLRTETAAMVGAALVLAHYGRLG